MAELDDVIHQPLRLRIMAALNALPGSIGLEFSQAEEAHWRHRRQSRRTYRDLGQGRLCPGRQGLCRQEAAATTVTATAAGRGAFVRHVATLQEIIAGGEAKK